MHSVVAT